MHIDRFLFIKFVQGMLLLALFGMIFATCRLVYGAHTNSTGSLLYIKTRGTAGIVCPFADTNGWQDVELTNWISGGVTNAITNYAIYAMTARVAFDCTLVWTDALGNVSATNYGTRWKTYPLLELVGTNYYTNFYRMLFEVPTP